LDSTFSICPEIVVSLTVYPSKLGTLSYQHTRVFLKKRELIKKNTF